MSFANFSKITSLHSIANATITAPLMLLSSLLLGQNTLTYLEVQDNVKRIQNFLKITNLILEDKRHVTPFVHSLDPNFFFYIFFLLSFFLSSIVNTTPPHTWSSLYLLFLFFFLYFSLDSLFLFLFCFPLPSQILPLWIFFLPSLYFVDGNPSILASGLVVFDRMTGFGFNSNIGVQFWTLVDVIGLRSFRFSLVSL